MKVAKTTTLKFASTATTPVEFGGKPTALPGARKAAVGSGGIITPALAAHARKKMMGENQQSLSTATPALPAQRKAAIGGGGLITPALAAHARKKMAGKN